MENEIIEEDNKLLQINDPGEGIDSQEVHEFKEIRKKRITNANYSQSNFLSRLFFIWLGNVISKANKGILDTDDVSQVSKEQSINYSIDAIKKTFLKYTNNEKFNNHALFLTIFFHNYKLFLLLIILDLIDEGMDYVRMFFYGKIIEIFSSQSFFPDRTGITIFDYFTKIDEYPFNIIEAVIIFIIIKLIKSLLYSHIQFNTNILVARISNQMIALLTEKILTSNTYNWLAKGEGELLNLAEVDADRIGNIFLSGPKILTSPIKAIVSLILLYRLFKFYFLYVILIIIIIMIAIVFIQIYYIKNMNILLMYKDVRMKIVSYVFQTLKPLKLNGLEDEFIQRIQAKRNDELKLIRKTFNIDIITSLINNNINLIITIFCLCFFAYSGNKLDIKNLFTAYQLIQSMSVPMIFIPVFFKRLFSNLLSVKRLQAFLITNDYDINLFKNKDKSQEDLLIKFSNVTLGLQNVPVEVPENSEERNPQNNIDINTTKKREEEKFEDLMLLKNISFTLKKGEFLAIVGPIGSGKSCLVNAILNNYHIFSQDENPIINGEISFCPQQPWITTNTIKHNIIFYNKYDPVKYKKIISSCQLINDFSSFVDGDETIINSSSANVSGGQKARIALARCLYKDADIYLFDDPFSSIDNKVKNLLFNELINGYLKDKGKVLVTNDVNKCKHADKILFMEKGSIKFIGTYQEYLQKYASEDLEESVQLFNIEQKNDEKKDDVNDNNGLMTEEEEEEAIEKNPYINKYFHSNKGNNVSCKTYVDFIKYQGGFIITLILVILIILSSTLQTYTDTFIPSLAEDIDEKEYDNDTNYSNQTDGGGEKLRRNLPSFIKISSISLSIFFSTQYIIIYISVCSIKKLHEEMVYKLAKAPINLFHDIVPIGQIINHLTKDIEIVQSIIIEVNVYIEFIFSLISSLILCYSYNKSTLYFCPIMILITIFLTKYYLNTGRYLKRMARISYSPIMTIINESIKGVDIIRSSHAEKPTVNNMHQKLDEYFGINLYVEGCVRWYDLWSSISVQLFFCGMLFYMIYYHKYYNAESAAIILQATEQFLTLVIDSTMYLSQLEISMIGLERCLNLLKVNGERVPEKDITKDLKSKNWPSRGRIEIKDYSCRYRPETPIILKNVNLTINPGEKIGIVGRTGSGKSSLIISLARIIEPLTGAIYIDGVDLQTVNLEFLRNKLSVVAQDTFLIESTLRDNVDPLNEHSDEEVLKVLNDFCLFDKYGNDKLNVIISENGKNLSLGEKQLIAFARTVLKKNKIIILDEATSSMDIETEKVIQNNMQKYFGDSTVIMIAHHLNMVKDCQTIVVVDSGEIVETGSYSDLIADKNSIFYSLNAMQNNS